MGKGVPWDLLLCSHPVTWHAGSFLSHALCEIKGNPASWEWIPPACLCCSLSEILKQPDTYKAHHKWPNGGPVPTTMLG